MTDYFKCHRCRGNFVMDLLVHHPSGRQICEHCIEEIELGHPPDDEWYLDAVEGWNDDSWLELWGSEKQKKLFDSEE